MQSLNLLGSSTSLQFLILVFLFLVGALVLLTGSQKQLPSVKEIMVSARRPV